MRHFLTCWLRARWRRQHYGQPFWCDDNVARLLEVADHGCPRCGRGAIDQRDRDALHDEDVSS